MLKAIKRHPGLCSVSLFLLLLLAACTGSEKMRRDLDALQEKNLADSLLTDSTLAMTLADYFDSHGTQAERLEAHYLLARTWTDLGQAPRALDAFHTAAEQADTTRLDSLSCHWLSRIYGQMAELLYRNQLPYNALIACKHAYRYAKLIHEDLVAINYRAHEFMCYYHLNQLDSALIIAKTTRDAYLELGDTLSGNTNAGALAYLIMTQQNDYVKARELLTLYEHHSHLSEEAIMNREDWKLLYVYKGHLYLGLNIPDSAIHYFSKAVKVSSSANIRGQGYEGLAKTYAKIGIPDSVQKYAMLNTITNDSVFRLSTSSALLSVHHLYDYDRFREEAERKTAEAEKTKRNLQLSVLAFLLLCSMTAIVIVRLRDKNRLMRHRMNAKYVSDILRFNALKSEFNVLRNKSVVDNKRLTQLQESLAFLRKSISTANNDIDLDSWSVEENLNKTPAFRKVSVTAARGERLKDCDWIELRQAVNVYLPGFIDKLSELNPQLSLLETQICILSKLKFTPTEIGILIGKTSSALANSRRRLLKKLYDIEGSPKQFDQEIRLMTYKSEEITH